MSRRSISLFVSRQASYFSRYAASSPPARRSVEVSAVAGLVQERPAVVLAVDIEQQRAELPELRGCDALAVNRGAALALGAYAAAYDYSSPP